MVIKREGRTLVCEEDRRAKMKMDVMKEIEEEGNEGEIAENRVYFPSCIYLVADYGREAALMLSRRHVKDVTSGGGTNERWQCVG